MDRLEIERTRNGYIVRKKEADFEGSYATDGHWVRTPVEKVETYVYTDAEFVKMMNVIINLYDFDSMLPRLPEKKEDKKVLNG